MCKEELARVNDKVTTDIASTKTYTSAMDKSSLNVSEVLAEQQKRDLRRQLA